MRQEKWDKLHKELDDALEAEFGSVQSIFENAKLVLREHIIANKEQVARDLQEMREKSSTRDLTLEQAAANLADPNICKTDNWIAGAQWQAERMYSEEDMQKAFKVGFSNGFASDILSTEKLQKEKERLFYEWFEQFKNK